MKSFTKLLAVLLISATFGILSFQNIYARETRSQRVVILDPPDGEVKNFYTTYGENVEIKGEVNGDVYAAGEYIEVTGTITGDLLAVGKEIYISGEVEGNVRVIAQHLNIDGKVNKNITLVAESLEITEKGWVGGGIASISSDFQASGPIIGQITAGAKDINFDNSVGGPSELWVETLAFGSGAVVGNSVNYHSDKDVAIADSASVSGTLTRVPFPQVEKEKTYSNMSSAPFKIISFLGSLIIGLLILKFFPKFTKKVVSALEVRPINKGLIGLGLMILLPIISFVLLITFVGAPLSVFIMVLYLSALYFAKIFASIWVGKKLLPNSSSVVSFGVGLLLYYVVAVIPFIGGLVSVIAKLVLMGALYTIFKSDLSKETSGK